MNWKVPILLFTFALGATPSLAGNVPTTQAMHDQISRSSDCKGIRKVGLAAELCWWDLEHRSELTNEQRTQKRNFANLYGTAQTQHDTKLNCKPPLGGLGNGDRKPEPGETAPGPWDNPLD